MFPSRLNPLSVPFIVGNKKSVYTDKAVDYFLLREFGFFNEMLSGV